MKPIIALLLASAGMAAPIDLTLTPNPDVAVYGKAFSPNGVYGFWVTPEGPLPIMDGPNGLILADQNNLHIDVWGGALVDNTGIAVLNWVDADNALAVFDYATEQRYALDPSWFLFEDGLRGSEGE